MGDSEIQIPSCEFLLQCKHLTNGLQANLCCFLSSCLDGEQNRWAPYFRRLCEMLMFEGVKVLNLEPLDK